LHDCGSFVVVPLHVELTQAEQVGVVEVKEDSFATLIHDVEGAAKGTEDEQVEEEEGSTLLHNLQQHVDKEASLAEDAKEVENFSPHTKTSQSLH